MEHTMTETFLKGTAIQPNGKFYAHIMVHTVGKIHIGTFLTELEAHEAFKTAYKEWHGREWKWRV